VTVTVALRIEAAASVLRVRCPYCGQEAGWTCVTSAGNEAAFTHAARLAARLAELA
jgi:hypothetical protein